MFNRKEYMKEYNKKYKKKYYSDNRKRLIYQSGEWMKNNKDKRKVSLKRYKQHNLHKIKVRNATYGKYGRMPKNWEYHHIPPYRIDIWIGVHYSEHKQIEKVI